MPSPSSQSSLRDEDDAAADDGDENDGDDNEARDEADKEADGGDLASENSFILLLLCPYSCIIPSIEEICHIVPW
jgi:hypothetical protein